MPDTPRRPSRREKPARTATEEVLEEVKEQEYEDDTGTGTSGGDRGGSGDPISPSPGANRRTAEGRPQDRA
ncbi:hypothetical protein ACFY93_17925 [Streptomyces sp. NPDC008313]|uniref:hypothetical protein n=1 Tax=Streptomyces sp. NPDC008313 TaxID=3364826 RepID=UPI0036EE15A6